MTIGTQVKNCYASIKSIEGALESLHETTRNPSLQAAIGDPNKLVAQIKSDMHHQMIELIKEEPQFKS